jgi:nucleoside-triphosphatase THEP1
MKVDEVGMLEGKARQFEQDIEKYRRRCEEL